MQSYQNVNNTHNNRKWYGLLYAFKSLTDNKIKSWYYFTVILMFMFFYNSAIVSRIWWVLKISLCIQVLQNIIELKIIKNNNNKILLLIFLLKFFNSIIFCKPSGIKLFFKTHQILDSLWRIIKKCQELTEI